MITFALAKGRLAEKAVALLIKAGIPCENVLAPTRKLELFSECGGYKFIFVKPSDVPTYVEHGIADLGVCGGDTLSEENANIYLLKKFNFGACRLAIAGFPKDKEKLKEQDITVATKYVGVAERYFANKKQNVKIIKLNGSVELGPIIGLSNFILDIVETGKTLEENGLAVLEVIEEVSACLVGNKVSYKTNAAVIKKLVSALG
jgi:ATP phosphoribosyltransferase